jgi:hypothetical protein
MEVSIYISSPRSMHWGSRSWPPRGPSNHYWSGGPRRLYTVVVMASQVVARLNYLPTAFASKPPLRPASPVLYLPYTFNF